MTNKDIDAGDVSVKYPVLPELLPYYSADGAIDVVNTNRYVAVYLGGDALTNEWKKEDVETQITEAKENRLDGTYGIEVSTVLRNKLKDMGLQGKRVLVIGSEKPWVEAIVLSLGAAHVTTLEYGAIQTDHPQISTLTPDAMRKAYQVGTLEFFDAVVTHSSIEHSGLGRYGDALNPWGDLLAISRAWCVSKPGAKMYLGVPIGKDKIEFNGHRIYGKIRFSLLATNWVQIDGDKYNDEDFDKPMFSDATHGLLFRRVTDFDEKFE
jgi:hypothetical protein